MHKCQHTAFRQEFHGRTSPTFLSHIKRESSFGIPCEIIADKVLLPLIPPFEDEPLRIFMVLSTPVNEKIPKTSRENSSAFISKAHGISDSCSSSLSLQLRHCNCSLIKTNNYQNRNNQGYPRRSFPFFAHHSLGISASFSLISFCRNVVGFTVNSIKSWPPL
jgi:hypothetical protein